MPLVKPLKKSQPATSDIKLEKIISTAEKMREAEHDAHEDLKIGTYRAGSTGLFQDSKFYGKCARKLFLRSSGIKSEGIPSDRQVMFAGGRMNETTWLEDLRLGSDYSFKTEEEIPTEWFTKAGTKVTGRPDIVFIKEDKPVLGLELKMVSSIWTARSIITGNPKFDHLTQAAHYMWQLDIPFKLVYTSYVDYAVIGGWLAKLFPGAEEPGSEFCEYKENKKGYLDIKKVLPFRRVYDLKWLPSGKLAYKEESEGAYTPTVITLQGVKDYFEELDKVQEKRELPARPVNIKADGTKESWTMCDYCSLKPVCDSSEHDLQTWLDGVESKISNSNLDTNEEF